MANYDRGKLQTRPTPLLLLINTQHCSLFQITFCRLWRQMPLIKDVCHPASYTVDHLLSGVQAKFIDCTYANHAILRLRTRVMQSPHCVHVLRSNLQIAHVLCNLEIACYAISRLPAQSRDSENAQHNLEFAQILRLRRTHIPYTFHNALSKCPCALIAQARKIGNGHLHGESA